MNNLFSNIDTFFSYPPVSAVAIVLIAAYAIASKKLRRLSKLPLGLFIIYLLLKFFNDTIDYYLGETNTKWLDVATQAALYCAIARIGFALTVEKWFLWKRGVPLPKITRDFVLIIIYAILVLVVMRDIGNINLVGLITTSAVLTASLGFAAQSTLANLFSGLSIQMDKPFEAGDWIEYGNYAGRIVQIGWRSTRIRTLEHELIVIPNSELTKTPVKNFSKPSDMLAMNIPIGVEYSAAPEAVRRTLIDVIGKDPDVLRDPPPEVRVRNFADSAVEYEMRVFFHHFDSTKKIRARLLERAWYALKRAGIQIPYPVRDVRFSHIERREAGRQADAARERAFGELRAVPILKPLSDADIKLLAEKVPVETYGRGEKIVVQDEDGDSAFIIHDGACNVEVKGKGGATSVVATLPKHSIFGEMSLLTGAPRSATIISNCDTTVFKIDRSLFAEVLTAHPAISEGLADMLVSREKELTGILSDQQKSHDAKAQIMNKIKRFFGLS